MSNQPVTANPSSQQSGQDNEIDRDQMLSGLRDSLHDVKDTVENDHGHRLRRIEADLRWLTLLLGAEIVALISTSIATIAGGG
jgi:hypothetical protein